jgi:hypothetical protein
MSNEIIQSVDYHYDDFQHINLIFSQNFISLFWGLFNDEIDLRDATTLPLKINQHSPLFFEVMGFDQKLEDVDTLEQRANTRL